LELERAAKHDDGTLPQSLDLDSGMDIRGFDRMTTKGV
jgi:hypothetical protein